MKNRLNYIVTFININGYYLALALTSMTLGLVNSSIVSIPVKGTAVLFMIIGLVLGVKKISLSNSYIVAFLVFILFYTIKLFIEAANPNPSLLYTVPTLALYMSAHCLLPFAYYFFVITRRDYKTIFDAFFYSGVIFNLVAFLIYRDLLSAGVGRIGNYQTNKIIEDMTLSPLVLAYTSIMVVVMALFKLISTGEGRKKQLWYTLAIVTALPNFLLGASRGAMIGLIISVLLYLLSSSKISKLRIIIYLIVLFTVFSNLALIFQSSIFDRFQNLFEDDNSENLRLILYKTTFEQFVESPILGGSIQNDTVGHFPHNIFLESLTATGIFGFLALFYLLICALMRVFYIFRFDSSNGWIGILFIIYFIHSLFNGAIYLSVGYWIFLGLLLGYKKKEVDNCKI